MITATVQPETVLLAVVVADTSPDRSRLISQSIARNLDEQIGQLDNRGKTSKVDVSVLSGPTLNPTPVSPRTKLNLAIGLLLGLGLGVAQAILRQQLDTSFQTRDQLAAVTGVPTLGQLSYDRNAKSSPVLTATTGHSRRAETFRQLRTNLRFVDAASPVSVLVVTSAVESEGKTTTAINLALTFAEAGSRVLLIDADLRKPKLENYLDLEASAGLTSVLIGEANVDDVVQDWGAQGLQVLASGPIPPNPSELLGSPTMEKVVAELRSSYDVVVIDSPPLLPVTDAAVTSVQADGVLFVVRHGKTRRDQVLQSMSQLDGVDTRILGTVLSMAPGSRRDNLPNYYQEPAS
nr:polysaccharide biosynthesis tyrosine autokinase [Microlunatus panaciterrae]